VKFVRLVLMMLMLLFMGVQYNDPDGLLWVLIYGTVAVALAISILRPNWLRTPLLKSILLVLTVLMAGAVWYYWPTQPQFWQQEVWWEEETAREGMGMMISLLFLLFTLPVAFGKVRTQGISQSNGH